MTALYIVVEVEVCVRNITAIREVTVLLDLFFCPCLSACEHMSISGTGFRFDFVAWAGLGRNVFRYVLLYFTTLQHICLSVCVYISVLCLVT